MIFFYELKKLVLSPLILGLVLLCIGVNALLTFTSHYEPFIGPPHIENAAPTVNIFEDYRTREIAEGYIRKYGITGADADHLREKYEQLQLVVDEKAADGDALSVYFGDRTPYLHGLLFGTLFPTIVAEICLLALFSALLSTTYEQMRNTESFIYASKTGRGIQLAKLYAALTLSTVASAVVIGVSLWIFFFRFDFSGVWEANVSSAFNRAINELKPLLTWNSFTVSEYLRETIELSIGLAICFCLFGYAAGTGLRHAYLAFSAAVSIIASLFLAALLFPIGSVLRSAWKLNPVWLWKNGGMWFTDGGADLLWPHFETLGFCASLIGLATMACLGFMSLKRRELH